MPISKTNNVFGLIKSLTKSEKRTFRHYAERIQHSDQLAYMKLFDIIDKQKKLDEADIRKKLDNIDNNKYANLKRHLYNQILISLRRLSVTKRPSVKINQYVDFAYVLYGKGLYMDALKILDKAKQLAIKHHHDFMLLVIYELEKIIHSRHITRSKEDAVEHTISDSKNKLNTITARVLLSNLRIRLHARYVKNGHVKDKKEEKEIRAFFQKKMSGIQMEKLGRMEKVHLYQSYVWYYYILEDFEQCYNYAFKWVTLFKEDGELQTRDINLFLRGYHYLLTGAYNLKKREEFFIYYQELETFRKNNYTRFNENTKIISFLYTHTARLNYHFLFGTFSEGVKIIPRTIARINRYKSKLDEHKIMVLYFKIAWMYMADQQPAKSVKYLNSIISMTDISLRKDIQAYARLLFLMVHYDLENLTLLDSMIKSYSRFFKKNGLDNIVQIELLQFFRKIINTPSYERKDVIKTYISILNKLKKNKYDKRAFLYLDCISWLRSKVEKKSIGEIIAAEI